MTYASANDARPAEVFSAKVAIVLLLVGVFSFSAFVTLSTLAPDLADGDEAAAHALSRSAIGYAGIVKLMRARGDVVTVSRGAPSANTDWPLTVLTPKTTLTTTDVQRLVGWRALVVLPKWIPVPSFTHRGWVSEGLAMSETAVADILSQIAPHAVVKRAAGSTKPQLTFDVRQSGALDRPGKARAGAIDRLQTITASDLTPIAKTEDGRTILGLFRIKDLREEDGSNAQLDLYVLSDPDFLNTQGIANLETARAGLAILDALRAPGDPIAFDVSLHGFEHAKNLLRLAFEPPLLAATLSLAIAAGLLGWRATTRDGPTARRKRAIALGKRALADNSAALIRLAGREHTMATRYAELTRAQTAAQVGVARDGGDTAAAELDRIAEARGLRTRFSDLAAEAGAAHTPAAAVTVARKLHSWNEEIVRATR